MNISKLLVRGVTTNITDSGNSGISSLLSQKKKISNHISYEKKIVSVLLKKVNDVSISIRLGINNLEDYIISLLFKDRKAIKDLKNNFLSAFPSKIMLMILGGSMIAGGLVYGAKKVYDKAKGIATDAIDSVKNFIFGSKETKGNDFQNIPSTPVSGPKHNDSFKDFNAAGSDPNRKFDTNDYTQFGGLSRRHESSGNPGQISPDRDGYRSYGVYQFWSSPEGSLRLFLKTIKNNRIPGYEKLVDIPVNTPAFNAEWQRLAKERGSEFFALQHQFNMKEGYKPLVSSVSSTGINLAKRGVLVHEELLSTSTQYGRGLGPAVVKAAFKGMSTESVNSLSDKEFLEKLMIYKFNNVDTNFAKSDLETRASVRVRILEELYETTGINLLHLRSKVRPSGGLTNISNYASTGSKQTQQSTPTAQPTANTGTTLPQSSSNSKQIQAKVNSNVWKH
jgi:hypothetical protein